MGVALAGILFGIILSLIVLNIKGFDKKLILGIVVILLLCVYALSIYVEAENIPVLLIGIAVGVVACLMYRFVLKDTKLFKLLSAEGSGDAAHSEEDFMNTRLGKIVTIIVAVLVIYAIASTLCIFRLNQKINSMVVITDELREEIAK